MQVEQTDCSAIVVTLPSSHCVHELDFTVAEYVPASQGAQSAPLVLPVLGLALPAVHSSQSVKSSWSVASSGALALYLPTRQAIQAEDEVPRSSSRYLPWAQMEQTVLPSKAYVPLMQSSQPELMERALYFPAMQLVHPADAAGLENVPGPQFKQRDSASWLAASVLSSAMYLPAPQSVHPEAVSAEYFPDAHMTQFCLSVVYEPASQEVQDVDSLPLNLPVAQLQQWVAPLVTESPWPLEAYVPAEHVAQCEAKFRPD